MPDTPDKDTQKHTAARKMLRQQLAVLTAKGRADAKIIRDNEGSYLMASAKKKSYTAILDAFDMEVGFTDIKSTQVSDIPEVELIVDKLEEMISAWETYILTENSKLVKTSDILRVGMRPIQGIVQGIKTRRKARIRKRVKNSAVLSALSKVAAHRISGESLKGRIVRSQLGLTSRRLDTKDGADADVKAAREKKEREEREEARDRERNPNGKNKPKGKPSTRKKPVKKRPTSEDTDDKPEWEAPSHSGPQSQGLGDDDEDDEYNEHGSGNSLKKTKSKAPAHTSSSALAGLMDDDTGSTRFALNPSASGSSSSGDNGGNGLTLRPSSAETAAFDPSARAGLASPGMSSSWAATASGILGANAPEPQSFGGLGMGSMSPMRLGTLDNKAMIKYFNLREEYDEALWFVERGFFSDRFDNIEKLLEKVEASSGGGSSGMLEGALGLIGLNKMKGMLKGSKILGKLKGKGGKLGMLAAGGAGLYQGVSSLFGGSEGGVSSSASATATAAKAAETAGGGASSAITGTATKAATKGVMGPLAKLMGPLGAALSLMDGWDQGEALYAEYKAGNATKKEFESGIAEIVGGLMGGFGGAQLGGMIGAGAGTMVAPGAGTALGGVLGAVGGWFGGESLGKYVAKSAADSILPEGTDPRTSKEKSDGTLGSLSRKYESSGDPGAIGHDRTGGYSYGSHQMASNKGTMGSFIEYLKQRDPEAAAKLEAAGGDGAARQGTPEFKSAFKDLAKNPEFEKAQTDFSKKEYLDPVMASLGKYGVDASKISPAMRETLYSTSIQHGPGGAKSLLKEISGKSGSLEGMSEKDIISKLYDARRTKFGSSSAQVQASVQNRLTHEKADALAMLDNPPVVAPAGQVVAETKKPSMMGGRGQPNTEAVPVYATATANVEPVSVAEVSRPSVSADDPSIKVPTVDTTPLTASNDVGQARVAPRPPSAPKTQMASAGKSPSARLGDSDDIPLVLRGSSALAATNFDYSA